MTYQPDFSLFEKKSESTFSLPQLLGMHLPANLSITSVSDIQLQGHPTKPWVHVALSFGTGKKQSELGITLEWKRGQLQPLSQAAPITNLCQISHRWPASTRTLRHQLSIPGRWNNQRIRQWRVMVDSQQDGFEVLPTDPRHATAATHKSRTPQLAYATSVSYRRDGTSRRSRIQNYVVLFTCRAQQKQTATGSRNYHLVPVEAYEFKQNGTIGSANMAHAAPRQVAPLNLSLPLISDTVQYSVGQTQFSTWLECDLASTLATQCIIRDGARLQDRQFWLGGPLMDFLDGGLRLDSAAQAIVAMYRAEDPGGNGEIECHQPKPHTGSWEDPVCGEPGSVGSAVRREKTTLIYRRRNVSYQVEVASTVNSEGVLHQYERVWRLGQGAFACPLPTEKVASYPIRTTLANPAMNLFHAATTSNAGRLLFRTVLTTVAGQPVLAIRVSS